MQISVHCTARSCAREWGWAQGFYQAYLLSLLQDILAVLTDRLHKPGFKMHASILQHIFGIVNTGKVTAPLWEGRADVTPTPGLNNQVSLLAGVAKIVLIA